VEKIKRTQITKQELSARNQRRFHESMRIILHSLVQAGKYGIEMTGGDGAVRKVHPILACYVADYPEQCLVACTKYGTCPKCQCPSDCLQEPYSYDPRTQLWTMGILNSAKKNHSKSRSAFYKACMESDVSGSVYAPFWEDLPYTDIHTAITPDVLHQLYQGVLKHLISWCQDIMTKEELDRRMRTLPPSFGVRHFDNGISALSQISGSERKHMGRILLGCLAGAMPQQGLKACRAILDFIYLSQYSTHDDITLGYLDSALEAWHENKDYFISTQVRADLNIPKFHSLHHYVSSIKLLGTTDNYNTEMFERLHIDFAKRGWRASNHRDEFPQMIRWLGRQEKVASFQSYIDWRVSKEQTPKTKPSTIISIAKHPPCPGFLISSIETRHGAPGFSACLLEYLNVLAPNPVANRQLHHYYRLPFYRLDVFHQFKFHPTGLEDGDDERDTVKAVPSIKKSPPRFDTVIVLNTDAAESTGVEGIKFLLYDPINF
jgi:hypothetical protein